MTLPFIQGERFAVLAAVPVMGLELILLTAALDWLIWRVFMAAPQDAPDRSSPAAGNETQRSFRESAASAALYGQPSDRLATSG